MLQFMASDVNNPVNSLTILVLLLQCDVVSLCVITFQAALMKSQSRTIPILLSMHTDQMDKI